MAGDRPAARMQLVEIADPDEDVPPGPASSRARPPRARTPGDGPSPAGAPRLPGWAWALAAVLVLLVAAAAVATGAVARRADARADRLAQVPGFVRALDHTPREVWRTAVPHRYGTVLAAGGTLVTVSDVTGTWTVTGRDPATGGAAWAQEVVEVSRAGFETVSVVCLPGPATSTLLVCGWVEPGVVYGRRQTPEPVVPVTRLVAFDATSGEPAGAWQVRDRLVGVDRVGDDLVVATATADRRVRVERRAGADGTLRWGVTSQDELVTTDGSRPDPRLEVGEDLVVLTGTSTAVLDAADGERLSGSASGRQLLVVPLTAGGFASWASTGDARLHDADGEIRAEVVGLPARLSADDRSSDALLVDLGRRVVAVDPDDGAQRWEQVVPLSPVAVVDGVVVLGGDVGVGAVDAVDGTVLWQQRVPQVVPFAPVTDGLVVVGPEPARGGGWALVGRGLRDGVRVWSVPLPDDARGLDVVGGRMVVRTPDEVVVLG